MVEFGIGRFVLVLPPASRRAAALCSPRAGRYAAALWWVRVRIAALPARQGGDRAFGAAWKDFESDVSLRLLPPASRRGAASLRSPRLGLCAEGHCNGWLPNFHVRMVAVQPLFGV